MKNPKFWNAKAETIAYPVLQINFPVKADKFPC